MNCFRVYSTAEKILLTFVSVKLLDRAMILKLFFHTSLFYGYYKVRADFFTVGVYSFEYASLFLIPTFYFFVVFNQSSSKY